MPPDPLQMQIPTDVLAFNANDRTLDLRIIPYGVEITHWGTRQQYTRVEIADGATVPFTVEHPESLLAIVGKLISHEQKPDGLYGTVRLANTAQANDLYSLAADGLVSDVSAGVVVVEDHHDPDTDVHTRTGILDHVAATMRGAFQDAKVLAVHSHNDKGDEHVPPTEEAAAEPVAFTREEAIELFDVSTLEDDVRQMRVMLDGMDSRTPQGPAPRPEPYEVFAAVLQSQVTGSDAPVRKLLEEYAIVASPGVSGGSSAAEGLIPADWWTGGLVNVKGGWRPLFSRLGAMPYPSHGTSVGFGKVVSGPTADERSAQDGDSESSALVVSAASAAIKWFDGAGRLPMEIVEQSDPAIMAVFWDRLVAAVNAKIEAYAVSTAVAAATHEGAVLTLTNYGTLVSDLITTSELIRTATDYPGDMIGMSTDDWIATLSMVDGSGRRIFATQGSAAADGSGSLTATSIDVGGITAFHVPGLSESLQFNQVALKGADKAPRRLQAVNVLKAGIEVGILGSCVVAPMIPTGIYSYEAV